MEVQLKPLDSEKSENLPEYNQNRNASTNKNYTNLYEFVTINRVYIMNNKDNFVIMRIDKGQWFCMNKIRRYILLLIISAIYYPCIVAQAGLTLQSNKIPGIEYRAGGYLHTELLTWGKVNNKGPFILVAGNKESFSVEIDIYKEIPAGNQIGVFLHFVSDLDPFQITDPAKPNFFTCESDDVDFNIQAFPNPVVHGSGSFFPYSKWAEIKLLNTAKPGA